MDLYKLDTKEVAAKGVWYHIKHPAFGHPLYTGEGVLEDNVTSKEFGKRPNGKAGEQATPVRVKLMGTDSPAVRDEARKLREGVSDKKSSDADNERRMKEFAASLIVGFEGLQAGGKPLEATTANKLLLLEQSDDYIRQITDFAADREAVFLASGGT